MDDDYKVLLWVSFMTLVFLLALIGGLTTKSVVTTLHQPTKPCVVTEPK